MLKKLQTLPSISLLLALAACSSNGSWPNLSDKMPDPSERERVFERADTSIEPRPADPAPTSEAEAARLVATISSDLANEEQAYRAARLALDEADAGNRLQRWRDAQLALTRLSITLSRLDPVIDMSDASSPAKAEASALHARLNGFVVAERQYLTGRQPQ